MPLQVHERRALRYPSEGKGIGGWGEGERNAPQHQRLYALRVRLRVRERQRRAPRPAKDVPLVDLELLAELLNVLHEVPRRVLLERRVRGRLSRAALVEEDDLGEVSARSSRAVSRG